MITSAQRTIYGLEYQANLLINEPYVPKPNTTLNEKFGLYVNEPVGSDTTHNIKYLAIGVGGDQLVAGVNSYSYSQHGVLDAALFDQIPFIMRPASNDLLGTEQDKYRFRIPIDINGVTYYQYFLRRIAPTDITTDTYLIVPGLATAATLTVLTTDTPAHLNPVPRSTAYVLNENSKFVSKMIKLKFELSPTELDEITSCIELLHGVGSGKTLTEIGICAGLDKMVSGRLVALQTQIYFHVGVGIDTKLTYDNVLGYVRAIELGGTENLYA